MSTIFFRLELFFKVSSSVDKFITNHLTDFGSCDQNSILKLCHRLLFFLDTSQQKSHIRKINFFKRRIFILLKNCVIFSIKQFIVIMAPAKTSERKKVTKKRQAFFFDNLHYSSLVFFLLLL